MTSKKTSKKNDTPPKELAKYPAVYVYRRSLDNGRELRYSLRTLHNIKNWNGQVFVIGAKENWFSKEIIHIPVEPVSDIPTLDQENKWRHLADKRIAEDFIHMNDDFYINKPVILKPLHMDELVGDESEHGRNKQKTAQYLRSIGIKNPLSYELHTPMIMNKSKRLKLCDLVEQNAGTSSLLPRSLYGNINQVGGEYYADEKSYDDSLPSAPYTSTDHFVEILRKKFSKISQFERNDETSEEIGNELR